MGGIKTFDLVAGSVTTTDATQTTLLSFTLPADGVIAHCEARITARKTSNSDLWITTLGSAARRSAGASAIVGAVTSMLAALSDAGMTTCSATIDASGTTVRVRVTGIIATNIDWQCELRVQMN